MRASNRALLCLATLLGCGLVVSAGAAGLYTFTDPELSGPEQPIQFSHKTHSTKLAMNCLYCHSSAAQSQHASVPALSVCMGCHTWVKKGELEGSEAEIAKLKEFWDRGESIPWIRVNVLPEHVQFKHFRHVFKNVLCQDCHGPVETMNRVWLTPDTKLRPSSGYLPAAKLQMGWCMDCHLKPTQPEGQLTAADDCAACHY